ncbi:MAG: mandelate racemase, partial [Pseudomonadales bacterium]|nr:mandelate racemase [Pseudomonadales bacterium]
MRITEIRDITVPLSGAVANAVVSFDDHTVSLVALVSDQVRNGKPVIGFGFNSIGRFGQSGIIRERLAPRILAAGDKLLADGGFDPAGLVLAAMKNEKPGGHGDRAGAVAAIELACWDLNAKLAHVPACELIAGQAGRECAGRTASVYAAGGYYYPADGTAGSGRGIRDELSRYADAGYTAFKMKIGGASLSDDLRRIDEALMVAGEGRNLAVDANGRFDQTAALEFVEATVDLHL